MRGAWTWMLLALIPVAPVAAEPMAAVVREQADVRSLADGRLLYRESHYVVRGSTSERWVLYRCPDGNPFARKRVLASRSAATPDFMLEDGRDGYREGVRGGGGERVAYSSEGGKESRRTLSIPADGVIDAGFDAAVRKHWDALQRGEAVNLQFLVPSRQQFFPVRVQRVADSNRSSARTLQLRMRLATWFGFAVPDVGLVYGLEDRRLRVFSGTGNVRDARGRNPQVRITFASQAGTASAEEFARTKDLPLDGRCVF